MLFIKVGLCYNELILKTQLFEVNLLNTYGWLIYNGGLRTPKYMELNELYAAAAKKCDINLELVANDELYACIENGNAVLHTARPLQSPEFILFLDKDIRLAKHLEKLGYTLFNSREVIENCDDKMLTFQILANSGIKMPKTFFCPLYFYGTGTGEPNPDFTTTLEKELGYPMVIKEAFGSFGAQVYLIHNQEELIAKQKELIYTPHLYQEFIQSSTGRDVRIYVVGDQVVASMYRHSDTDFRANISNGGTALPYSPNEAFCQMAIKATKVLEADFTGIDLLFGENDEPILCEVNSNAHIKNIYDCTGVDVAHFIFKYILEKIAHE
ncbi:MAG: RimK family alpha-L-glutamate ligase [Cellulosilyticum sp.]|nr:RimK family alpha-L-glutamate ligase [Cellulosilyticum sp.]